MSEGRASSYGTYQAKRTFYNGVWFKSNLEARVAEALDDLGVRWEYETRCFRDRRYEGGQYTPDFWLPECFAYLEVAGVIDERHMNNALVFCETQNVVNPRFYKECNPYAEEDFEEWTHHGDPWLSESSPSFMFVNGEGRILNPLCMDMPVEIAGCRDHSNHISFIDITDSWACRICGSHDGPRSLIGDHLFYPPNRYDWDDLDD